MKFIFDCADEKCLPAVYHMVDDVKAFFEKMKTVNVPEGGEKNVTKLVLENMMVHHPKETGALLARLWLLEEGESAPNAFVTMTALFTNKAAMDFFTYALPSLLQISRAASPLLNRKK
jgi:hypothetical protein